MRRLWSVWWWWVRARWRPHTMRYEIESDIANHLEEETGRLRARGVPAAHARRIARQRFGDINRIRRELQEIAMVTRRPRRARPDGAFWHDLRHAGRALRRTPGYAVMITAILGLGVGANTAMYSVATHVLGNTAGVVEPDRIVSVHNFLAGFEQGLQRQPIHARHVPLLSRLEGVHALAAFKAEYVNLTRGETPRRLDGMLTTPRLMDVAGVRPLLGGGFDPDLQGGEPVAIISYGLWAGEFGRDPDVLRRNVTLNEEPYQIVGVMPPDFRFPRGRDVPESFRFPESPDVWMPYRLPERGPSDLGVVVRMEPGVTVQQFQQQLSAYKQAQPEQFRRWIEFRAVPIQQQATGHIRPAVVALFCATALVLLIAAGNIAGLVVARTTTRQRELAIRATLGAGRHGIARYLLAETAWLAAIGTIFGLALTWSASRILGILAPAGIPGLAEVGVSWDVALYAAGMAGISTLTFGLMPSLRVGGRAMAASLAASARATDTRAARRLGDAVVTVEVGLTLALLIGAALLIRSTQGLLAIDPGFAADNLLTAEITLPEQKYPDEDRARRYQRARGPESSQPAVVGFHRQLLDRLRERAEVAGAALVRPLPLSGTQEASVYWIDGMDPTMSGGDVPLAEYTIVSDAYFETMGIPVLEGREFTAAERFDSEPVAIVNETFAKQWPVGSALGSRLKLGGAPESPYPWMRIVGIVGDVTRGEWTEQPRAEMYVPLAQGGYVPMNTLHAVVRGEAAVDAAGLRRALQSEAVALDPHVPLDEVATMDQLIARATVDTRFAAQLLSAFAAAAMLISAVGLYAVVTYAVTTRRREFALRSALGASPRRIVWVVLGRAVITLAAGLGLGYMATATAGGVIDHMVFNVDSEQPMLVALASGLLSIVFLIAAWIPARRATRADPAAVLRSD